MYNHEPADYVCPFCALVGGWADTGALSTESDIIYRGDRVTAFVGSHQWPQNPGNVIVIPNAHYENLYDIPLPDMARVQELVQAIARAMKIAWGCDGVSTRQHNEPVGNQDVWHYHIHVTPRYQGDRFYPTFLERRLVAVGERARYAADLREQLVGWKPAASLG
jgi:histidine triad (HIT) family protein